MKRRLLRWILIGGVSAVVLLLIAVIVGVCYLRSLASEQNVALSGLDFVTPDTTVALVVRWRPEDKGVLELSNHLIDLYDQYRNREATGAEKAGYLLLGFDRPSELLSRPLPAELAFIVRYDETEKRFCSYTAVSVSGMAGLLKLGVDHLGTIAPNVSARYTRQKHDGQILFVPKADPVAPGPHLTPEELQVLLPPAMFTSASWSLTGNNLLLAYRPEPLAVLLDDVDSISAGEPRRPTSIYALWSGMTKQDDLAAAVINKHGEFACLLKLMAGFEEADGLEEWLATPEAMDDLSSISYVYWMADVQPGDRIQITMTAKYTDMFAGKRVAEALFHFCRAFRLPPPIKITVTPELRMDPELTTGEVKMNITVSNVGKYLDSLKAVSGTSAR